MLYKVRIDNFQSIGTPQDIDLRARKSVEDRLGRLSPIYRDSAIRAPNVAVLFGPNAAGKSTVLNAIMFGLRFVVDSFRYEPNANLPYTKFHSSDMIARPTRLSYSFSGPANFLDTSGEGPECPYTYEISLSPRNAEKDSVVLERLSHQPRGFGKPVTIIERRDDGSLRHARKLMNSAQERALKSVLRPNASVICTLAHLNNEFATAFVNGLTTVQSNMYFSERLEGDEVIATRWYAANPSAFDRLQAVGRRIDLGIDGIAIDTSLPEPCLQFRHSGIDGGLVLQQESHGTRQFIKMYPWIHTTLEHGSIAVLDDIDASIHPSLLSEIFRWFGNRETNPNGAQLWASCHAASLLPDLTKEEVLFCEKNAQGCTAVWRLADIEGVRRDENFFGKYLGGEYGAIPTIG